MKTKFAYFLLIISFVFMMGCQANSPTQTLPLQSNDSRSGEEQSYPIADVPAQPESGYPITEYEVPYPKAPDFFISQPLKGGDLIVEGTGEPNLPLKLVDVSEVGEVLGETVINNDGTFVFSLDEPLKTNHLVGIQIGDLDGTEFEINSFLYNENYIERPMVGILFDMVIVE